MGLPFDRIGSLNKKTTKAANVYLFSIGQRRNTARQGKATQGGKGCGVVIVFGLGKLREKGGYSSVREGKLAGKPRV